MQSPAINEYREDTWEFYGVLMANDGYTPPTLTMIVREISPSYHDWVVEQLVLWVKENGGSLTRLSREAEDLEDEVGCWLYDMVGVIWHQIQPVR